MGAAVTIEPQLTVNEVFGFSIKLLLGCGLIFELPLLITFLAGVGVVTHRSLWRFNRYAIVLSFIVGAIITPGPDVMSQVLVSLPIVALYNLSILIAWYITKRREKRHAGDAIETTAVDDESAAGRLKTCRTSDASSGAGYGPAARRVKAANALRGRGEGGGPPRWVIQELAILRQLLRRGAAAPGQVNRSQRK